MTFPVGGCGKADGGGRAVGAEGDARQVLPGEVYAGTPGRLERFEGAGEWVLSAGETVEDAAFVAGELETDPEMPLWRNSLFLRHSGVGGAPEWRVVLTSGAGWRAEGMSDWMEEEFRERLHVLQARFASDGRRILLVLDPHTHSWFAVCTYDWRDKVLRFLFDGSGIEELSDGTLVVREAKSYRRDANGEFLGADWHDRRFSPDGREMGVGAGAGGS